MNEDRIARTRQRRQQSSAENLVATNKPYYIFSKYIFDSVVLYSQKPRSVSFPAEMQFVLCPRQDDIQPAAAAASGTSAAATVDDDALQLLPTSCVHLNTLEVIFFGKCSTQKSVGSFAWNIHPNRSRRVAPGGQ